MEETIESQLTEDVRGMRNLVYMLRTYHYFPFLQILGRL